MMTAFIRDKSIVWGRGGEEWCRRPRGEEWCRSQGEEWRTTYRECIDENSQLITFRDLSVVTCSEVLEVLDHSVTDCFLHCVECEVVHGSVHSSKRAQHPMKLLDKFNKSMLGLGRRSDLVGIGHDD